jgi:2-polyprenyl-3-methyl-5-hydroxy-6-metoxy-1,4-benzoquinol methylase
MNYNWDYLDKKAYKNYVGEYKTKKQFDFILRYKDHFHKILDIAGGSGRFALPLFDLSAYITVIDINTEAIDLLKRRQPMIDSVCGDFIAHKINDKYSLILCIEAISYFENYQFFFRKVHGIIENDGVFVFTYQNIGSWRYKLRLLNHLFKSKTTYNEINLQQLKDIIFKTGFEIIKQEGMLWLPMSVNSNNPLVFLFEKIEKIFRLRKWISQSPMVLFSLKKKLAG